MKKAIYASIMLCLSACRLSQPLPSVKTGSETPAVPAIAAIAPPAAGTAGITTTGIPLATSPKHAPGFLHQVAARQPKIVALVRCTSVPKTIKTGRLTTTSASGIVADRPLISPGKSLILAGVGAIIVLAVALIIPSVTTIGGAIAIGSALALGVTLTLLGFFSYLLGLYEKGRVAQAAQPKR